MRATEEDFTIEDWRHFMTYCGNNLRYTRAMEHIRKLEAKETQQTDCPAEKENVNGRA